MLCESLAKRVSDGAAAMNNLAAPPEGDTAREASADQSPRSA
jgi:hypothetical protein